MFWTAFFGVLCALIVWRYRHGLGNIVFNVGMLSLYMIMKLLQYSIVPTIIIGICTWIWGWDKVREPATGVAGLLGLGILALAWDKIKEVFGFAPTPIEEKESK